MASSMHRLGSTARRAASRIALGGVAFALVAACSSSDDKSTGTSDASVDTGATPLVFDTSAAVSGAADDHCASVPAQPTNAASCTADASAPTVDAGGDDAGDDAAAGADAGDDMGGSDYGPTMNGSEADDDDCKYHVKWAATKVAENQDVVFQIIATKKSDNSPATGANTDLEVFLSDTHPAPNSHQTPTEVSPGTYQVGPVRFDAAGKWTVRVHLFEQCEDTLPDSPHGHAAFYVNVP